MSKRKMRERIAALEARVVALEARPVTTWIHPIAAPNPWMVPATWYAPHIDLTPIITCTALTVGAVPGGAS